MATHTIESYKGRYLYILDACDDIPPGSFSILSEHYQKQSFIRSIFKKCTDYKIKNVKFPESTTSDEVVQYFVRETRKLSKDDQIIIYFHGVGAKNGPNYTW